MQDGKLRILLLDTKFRNPNHYICIALRDALGRAADVEFVIKAEPLNAINRACEHRCNLFIAFDGEELDGVLCERLAQVCGYSVLWVTEDPYESSFNRRNMAIFDLVFTNDSASVAEYGQKGRHLPLAGVSEFHDIPVLPVERPLRYELFFAGTAWPNRTAFIRSILHKMPADWRFKLALPTNDHLPPRAVDLPESTMAWRTSPPDFARFVNSSAITILLPRVFSASGNKEFAETPPPRLFEAALAGGVQLVQEKLAEASLAFEPGREIVLFSDENDFFEKAGAIICDRNYRNAIATAARQRALREHTYDQRVARMLREVRESTLAACWSEWVSEGRQAVVPTCRKTILFVCHNVIGRKDFGGIEVYLDRLQKELTREFNVLFYVRGGSGERKQSLLLSHDYRILKRYAFAQASSTEMLSSPEREKAFYSVLVDYRIDLVHFHHFIGHVPALVHIARSLGVPSAFTVHDYTALCNEFQLISFNGQFCGAPHVSLAQCDVCLWKKHQFIPGSQAARRDFWHGVLAATDLLIFNTAGSRDLLGAMYPAVSQHKNRKILPVPILDDQVAALGERNSQMAFTGSAVSPAVLKVAIPGNVTHGKGGDLIAPLLSAFASAPVEFHVFGRLDSTYTYLADRRMFPNATIHGVYAADQLPVELIQCDISLHISIWPETYCLTLSEAWQNGIVPIVADIGALGERVEHGVNGIKVKAGAVGELINALRLLMEDRFLLERLRRNVPRAAYETLTDHVVELSGEYRRLFRNLQPPTVCANHTRRALSIAELGLVLQSGSWVQHGTAPQVPITDSASRADQRAGRYTGASRQRVFHTTLLARLRNVQAFYADHGTRKTTELLIKRMRKALWMR